MPAKPIKHGIKVYALCCAYTCYLYLFEIYTGKGGTPEGFPKGVISRLIYGAEATGTSSCIIYTNNFYTLLLVMKYIYASFVMLQASGHVSSDEKNLASRMADNFPFVTLS
jgi:hypothetical protein